MKCVYHCNFVNAHLQGDTELSHLCAFLDALVAAFLGSSHFAPHSSLCISPRPPFTFHLSPASAPSSSSSSYSSTPSSLSILVISSLTNGSQPYFRIDAQTKKVLTSDHGNGRTATVAPCLVARCFVELRPVLASSLPGQRCREGNQAARRHSSTRPLGPPPPCIVHERG